MKKEFDTISIMKRNKIFILCSTTFFIGVFLASCGSSGSTIPPVPISYSETDIQNAAICGLQTFKISLGDWVGDRQCTALARLLTTAPSYGKDADGSFQGGYDYIIQQQNRGIHIPLLAEMKIELKPCDNMVLVGPEYVAAGHTVVVYYPDLANDRIYYLDQNFAQQGVTLRQLSVSKNENNTYVIAAECKKPINCNLGDIAGPIIAAPQPSVPSFYVTIEAATVQSTPPTETPLPFTDINYLIGTWEGELVVHTDGGENSTVSMTFKIRNECNGINSPCVNADPSNSSNGWLLPFLSQNGIEYCFGLGLDVDPTNYCFTPQDDGTLSAILGTMFARGSGILHRKLDSDLMVTPLPADWWPDSLIGLWEGPGTDYNPYSQIYITSEIRRIANGQMIVIEDYLPVFEQWEYTNSHTTDGYFYYCFSNYQVVAGERALTGERCFSPITDDQIKYFGWYYQFESSGILTRVK